MIFKKHTAKPKIPFDPETQYPVILASICTGEKAAGFRHKTDKKFTEVMLVRTEKDEEEFKKMYGFTEIRREY